MSRLLHYPSGTKALRTLRLTASRLDERGTRQRKYGSFYTCSNIPSSSECSQSLVGYIRASLRAATNLFHLVGNILGIKEESRAGVIQALWAYIKAHNLQDKVDRKRIHADAMLRPVRVHKFGRWHTHMNTHFRYLAPKWSHSVSYQSSPIVISRPQIQWSSTTQ